MDAIKYLIDPYDLEDRIGENQNGVFQHEDLQRELHHHEDYEEAVRIFGNLSRVSENHLRAFFRVLRL